MRGHSFRVSLTPLSQAQQQFQPQFAAAAMNQYAGYGRGLTELDHYRNHHMQYRPQMEIPGGYTVLPPGAGTYLAPAPHLGYYRQYPGMVHVTGSGGENRVRGAPDPGPSPGASGAASAGKSPEAAPPPPLSSSAAAQHPNQQQAHPKESILSSLMAARAERLARATDDADVSCADAPPAASSPASHPAQAGSSSAGTPHHLPSTAGASSSGSGKGGASGAAAGGQASTLASLGPHQPFSGAVAGSPLRGQEATGNSSGAGAAAAAAAAVTAATAMHLTGLRGGFPTSMHTLGGIPGMTPPSMQAAVTIPGGPAPPPPSTVRIPSHQAPPEAAMAMNAMHYMGAAAAAVAAAGAGSGGPPGPGPSAMGFSSHDAFEEHLRQQEKKMQKRAANRKSAQLSRKRKKALIEELKFENQDLQRHEDILEVIPDPVFAFDATGGGVWFASNSASAQFGLTVEELTSVNFFDLMTEDCAKRLRVLIDTAAKGISDNGSSLLHEVGHTGTSPFSSSLAWLASAPYSGSGSCSLECDTRRKRCCNRQETRNRQRNGQPPDVLRVCPLGAGSPSALLLGRGPFGNLATTPRGVLRHAPPPLPDSA